MGTFRTSILSKSAATSILSKSAATSILSKSAASTCDDGLGGGAQSMHVHQDVIACHHKTLVVPISLLGVLVIYVLNTYLEEA